MPNSSPLSGEERKLDFGAVRSVEDFGVKCLLQLYVPLLFEVRHS